MNLDRPALRGVRTSAATLLVSFFVVAACGGDGGANENGSDPGSAGAAGASSSGPEEFRCTSLAHSTCEFCTCDACGDAYRSCADTSECLDILRCVLGSGCKDDACVLTACDGTLAARGGADGPAAQLAVLVAGCGAGAGCKCPDGAAACGNGKDCPPKTQPCSSPPCGGSAPPRP